MSYLYSRNSRRNVSMKQQQIYHMIQYTLQVVCKTGYNSCGIHLAGQAQAYRFRTCSELILIIFYRTEQNILCLTFDCISLKILSCITNFIHKRQYKYHLGQICFLRMPYHKWSIVFCFWLCSMYGGISTYSTIVSSLR